MKNYVIGALSVVVIVLIIILFGILNFSILLNVCDDESCEIEKVKVIELIQENY